MESTMNEVIIQRQMKAMTEAGYDALIAISPENFAYTAGFTVPSQPILRWRHALAIVKADGQSALVVVDMEESRTRNSGLYFSRLFFGIVKKY